MKPWSQNFRLAEPLHFLLQIFPSMIAVFTNRGFYLIVPLEQPKTGKVFGSDAAMCILTS